MRNQFDQNLMEFIEKNPTCYHVCAGQAKALEKAGFQKLNENEEWDLKTGGKYYVTRNDSALIAFSIPEGTWDGFSVTASHCDSPCLKIKENPEVTGDGTYTKLNVEMYGGAIYSTWFDRPLGIAGRVMVRNGGRVKSVLIDFTRDMVIIPSLAIHMNRKANEGVAINIQNEMLPLYALGKEASVKEVVASQLGISQSDILGTDLFVVNNQQGTFFGENEEFMASPRLDDVACVYASLVAILNSIPGERCAVHAVLDNEEVGSSTRQGAASTFLKDTLERISEQFHPGNTGFKMDVAGSFMLSADNGHAVHPNYPEKCDVVNRPVPGKGIILKFSANQKYTTDGSSAAQVKILAEKAGINVQVFTNRSDIPGGSTLGNISGNQIAIPTADVGMAQLAMHSAYETCGTGDCEDMSRLMKKLFEM